MFANVEVWIREFGVWFFSLLYTTVNCTTSVLNYNLLEFFYFKFDHSFYSKICENIVKLFISYTTWRTFIYKASHNKNKWYFAQIIKKQIIIWNRGVYICLSCCFHRAVPCDLSKLAVEYIYCDGFGLAQFVFCDDVRGRRHMRFVLDQGVSSWPAQTCERPLIWRCVLLLHAVDMAKRHWLVPFDVVASSPAASCSGVIFSRVRDR